MEDLGLVNFAVSHAVSRARRTDNLSQSELARRAGLSPSAISRIESGIVRGPDGRTLNAIARALGRSADLLGLLADERASFFYGECRSLGIPLLEEVYAESERALHEEPAREHEVEEDWEERVFEAVIDYWVTHRVTDEFAPDAPDDTRWALEEFLQTWTALTDQRKERLLAYMRDQASLSMFHDRHHRGTRGAVPAPAGSQEDD